MGGSLLLKLGCLGDSSNIAEQKNNAYAKDKTSSMDINTALDG